MIYLRRQSFIYLGTPSSGKSGWIKPRIKELKPAGEFVLHCCRPPPDNDVINYEKRGDSWGELINYFHLVFLINNYRFGRRWWALCVVVLWDNFTSWRYCSRPIARCRGASHKRNSSRAIFFSKTLIGVFELPSIQCLRWESLWWCLLIYKISSLRTMEQTQST